MRFFFFFFSPLFFFFSFFFLVFFPQASLEGKSVGYKLEKKNIYEREEAQTDESFFPVCLMNVCMIKLSLESNSFFFCRVCAAESINSKQF